MTTEETLVRRLLQHMINEDGSKFAATREKVIHKITDLLAKRPDREELLKLSKAPYIEDIL